MYGLAYHITDDLTDQDLEKKTRLQPVTDKALSENCRVKYVDGIFDYWSQGL